MSCSGGWDINQFLLDFPQFADVNEYSQDTILFWDSYSSLFFNVIRWGRFYLTGRALLLAHNLTLSKQEGRVKGLLTDKSVDSVSGSFDVSQLTIENAASYNSTVYGIQYYKLVQIIGAGPIGVI
jgi:hypothetical protein